MSGDGGAELTTGGEDLVLDSAAWQQRYVARDRRGRHEVKLVTYASRCVAMSNGTRWLVSNGMV